MIGKRRNRWPSQHPQALALSRPIPWVWNCERKLRTGDAMVASLQGACERVAETGADAFTRNSVRILLVVLSKPSVRMP